MLKAWKNVYQRKSNNTPQAEKSKLEKDIVKDGILGDVTRTAKLLLQYGVSKSTIQSDCWIANDLCHHLDEAFRHGLRQPASGYWPYVRNFTHANNVSLLENASVKKSTLERGRAWLSYSLNEGSLESYLQAFSCDYATIRKYYTRDSLLRDNVRREALLALLAKDSGVALLDSDLSEPLDSLQDDQEDDTATLNELEDNRINRLLSLEMDTSGKCLDPCIQQLAIETEKLTMEKSEKIVLRTPKKTGKESNRHLKRVSFHEECFSQNDFSVSFVAPGTAVLKKDTVKGRYSWCAGGDAPFVLCDTQAKTNSLCLLQAGNEEERQDSVHAQAEYSSQKRIDILRIRRRQQLKKSSRAKSSLYWPNLKPDPQACQQVLQELELEMEHKKINSESDVLPLTESTLGVLKTTIFISSDEEVYKVYKAYGPLMQSEICPLLIILTHQAIYLVGTNAEGSYVCHFSVLFSKLQSILQDSALNDYDFISPPQLGPSGQTLFLSSCDKEYSMLAVHKCEAACNLLSHVELALRKHHLPLPHWRWLALEDMKFLWHGLARRVPSLQSEHLLHFCLVHIQDETKNLSSPPASKEGLLMMRIGHTGPWVPAFLGLRESELWIFGDEVERDPQMVLSLVRCQGCHRSLQAERPHTFEIICGRGSAPLQLAAADEYEASDWLQALLQAASGPVKPVKATKRLELCGLIVSSGHLLTFSVDQEVPQPLCHAALSHLTSLRIATPASN
ncbi:hypothetical protein B566_EDAN011138 [Ephemera danica]|nr:hypothetical protein B566_EDAN011138 [Ephemera danica]